MPKVIDQPIVGYQVITAEKSDAAKKNTKKSPEKTAEIVQMHESLARPEMLLGSTYKIKTPLSDHALYITINDIVLNQGTSHELRRPFEIFINSKSMDHFQWVVALTRVISAVFRKGGDCTFLVEELKAVFDPKGGYFKGGGKFMPSLVAELGEAIESHLKMIGMIVESKLDTHQQQMVDAKRAEFAVRPSASNTESVESDYPSSAQLCNKCLTKAAVLLDGCMTCLSCGDSKCG